MTSRPVPATLPPPQRPPSVGIQHARNRSRPSGPPHTFKPSMAADANGTAAPAPPTPADESNKPGAVKAASIGPDGKPNPVPEGVPGERQGQINLNRTWSGKPQLVFEDAPAVGNENARPSGTSTTGPSGPNPTAAFPPRPGLQMGRSSSLAVKSARPEVSGGRKDGPKKHTFEPPLIATRYPHDKSADFFPWTRNHPEDVLNEQVIRSGYVDTSNKEFTSARHSIGPYLKNKAHLQTLSSLFVSVLEKRQTQGRLTGPSNFRPLPRVTLKDTKREEWLRDLANPAIPLRKLSKTIPHGIRGKVLLEQFLAKRIPATRAIWLAKCVGANEIRAFKRKGASGGSALAGEIKWVREWTVFVEQFVENTITQVGQTDWKSKMEYTVRLASHLYSEHLLDQDHYLDWLVSSFETTSLDKLPIWLLQLQIYWKDLVSFRCRARRLAAGFLDHITLALSKNDASLVQPILQKLHQGLVGLAIHYPSCLVLPNAWETYKPILTGLPNISDSPLLKSAVSKICQRNESLSSAVRQPASNSQSDRQSVVSLLDGIREDFHVETVSSSCLETIPSFDDLAVLTLQWASSVYRDSQSRIYIATRLLRKWASLGYDVDNAVLSFLKDIDQKHGIHHYNVFRVVAELVRSKHFPVGKYLQWLIASGALAGVEDISNAQSCLLGLITQIPVYTLPTHILNLRKSLLRDAQFDVAIEDEQMEACQTFVAQQLPDIVDLMSDALPCDEAAFCNASLTVRLEVSRWIRQQVANHTTRLHFTSDVEKDQECLEEEISAVTPSQAHTIRHLLECLEDFPILADVLGVIATSPDPTVLASIADTLNYHACTFAAIGALLPLSKRLLHRYQSLRMERPIDRAFCLALADLCCRIRADQQVVEQLKLDLTRCEPKAFVPVCSPVSDNMVDGLQNPKADFEEEIERVLYSGTSIDEQTLARVFEKIWIHMDENAKNASSISAICPLFQRLRNFDERAADRIVLQRVESLLKQSNRGLLSYTLTILVNAGCFALPAFVQCAEKCFQDLTDANPRESLDLACTVLELILPAASLAPQDRVPEVYRLRLEQQKYCDAYPTKIVDLIIEVARLTSIDSIVSSCSEAQQLLRSSRVLAAMRFAIVHRFTDVSHALSSLGDQTNSIEAPKQILDSLFDPEQTMGLASKDTADQIKIFMQTSDELSLRFCQLQLQHVMVTARDSGHESQSAAGGSLFQGIEESLKQNSWTWMNLLSGLGPIVTSTIREQAEQQILSAMERNGNEAEPIAEFLKKYLAVVGSTTSSIPKEGQVEMASALIERLRTAADMLSSSDDKPTPADMTHVETFPSVDSLCHWLHALLYLAIIHKAAFQANRTEQASFFAVLATMIVHPKLQALPESAQYLFDVAAYLSDDLTDDMRASLQKMELLTTHSCPRLSYVFGKTSHPDSWLGLALTPAGTTPSNRGASPATSLARPNVSQQQQQQQQPPNRQPAQPSTPNTSQQQPQRSSATPGTRLPPHMLQQQQQSSGQRSQAQEAKPLQVPLRRWEILPDPTSNANANDTALSLSLFGARKV